MYLAIEVAVLCAVFFVLCYLGTGDDKKNIKSYASYPDEVQKIVREREDLAPLIKETPWYIAFISNVVTFTIVLFIFAVGLRQNTFLANFVMVLILGESLNAFDFLVIDTCWWRNSRRIRFTGTEDRPEIYKPVTKHFYAFLRGAVCFLVVALIVGGIISLF